MHKNAMQRLQVLEILYLELEAKPRAGWVNERKLKELGDIEFAIATILELGQAKRNGFNYRITGVGMLVYEAAQEE